MEEQEKLELHCPAGLLLLPGLLCPLPAGNRAPSGVLSHSSGPCSDSELQPLTHAPAAWPRPAALALPPFLPSFLPSSLPAPCPTFFFFFKEFGFRKVYVLRSKCRDLRGLGQGLLRKSMRKKPGQRQRWEPPGQRGQGERQRLSFPRGLPYPLVPVSQVSTLSPWETGQVLSSS